jgi:hypothetical protein
MFITQGPAYIPFRQPGVKASLVSIRDERTHGNYRKMISNAYSLSSLKAYEPCIDQQITRFMEVCDEHSETGTKLNLSLWCQYCKYEEHNSYSSCWGRHWSLIADANGRLLRCRVDVDYG